MAVGETNEFDILRQRVREREQQNVKEGKRATTTQFANRGTLGSGAQIRAEERSRAQAAKIAQEERRDILIAEADVRRREREAEAQRRFLSEQAQKGQQFQREERIGQQEFAGEQARVGREFASSERQAQQAFAANEAARNRAFTSEERVAAEQFVASERQAQQDFVAARAEAEAALKRELQTNQLNAEQSRFAEEIALKKTIAEAQERQFISEFNASIRNNIVNARVSLKNSGYTDGQIAALFRELDLESQLLDTLEEDLPVNPIAVAEYITPGAFPFQF